MDDDQPHLPALPNFTQEPGSRGLDSEALVSHVPNVGLVVDFGEQGRRKIKRLKRGRGALTRQIQAAVEEAQRTLGIDADTEIVPVVLLYRRPTPKYNVACAKRRAPRSGGAGS